MDELNEGLSVEDIIPVLNEILWDSVNNYHEHCRRDYLKVTSLTVKESQEEWNMIPLPSDFLRLGEIESPDWDVPVLVTHPVESPEYRLEANKYLRSGARNPRAYLVDDGGLKLKFRGKPTKVTYQKRLNSEKDINPRALDSLSWFVAGDVFLIFGEPEKAKICKEKA